MAKKSVLASDSEFNKHVAQPGLYAHRGADYFIPKGDFYDASLSPVFGNTFIYGDLTVGEGSGSQSIIIDRPAGYHGRLQYKTDGDNRWSLFCDNTAEGGSDAGSDLNLNASDDDGDFLATVLTVIRAGSVSNTLHVEAGMVGLGTDVPSTVADYTSLTGSVLNIRNSGNARAVIEGDPAYFDLVDIGGGTDDKWFQTDINGGEAQFNTIKDDGSAVQQNLFKVDLGDATFRHYGDVILSNADALQWRNQADDGTISVLWVNSSDNTVLNATSGQDIQILIGTATMWAVSPTGGLQGQTNITTWASILTDKDSASDAWSQGVHSDTAAQAPVFRLEKSRGSRASPTYVQADDELGDFAWYGYNRDTSPAYVLMGAVRGFCDVTPTSGSDYVEARLEFLLCHDETAALSRKMTIVGQQVIIGDSTTLFSDVTRGLVIDQGAYDDAAIALSSSDVGHGCTTYASTTVYSIFRKQAIADGGLLVRSFTEASVACQHQQYVTTHITAKTSTAGGSTLWNVHKISGTGITNVDANANLYVWRGYLSGANQNLMILDAEGTLHLDDTTASDVWDDYDDVVLARDLSRVLAKKWGDTVKYNVQDMHDAGLLTYTPYENGKFDIYLNLKNMVKFGFCTIMQIGEKLQAYEQRIAQLEAKLLEA